MWIYNVNISKPIVAAADRVLFSDDLGGARMLDCGGPGLVVVSHWSAVVRGPSLIYCQIL